MSRFLAATLLLLGALLHAPLARAQNGLISADGPTSIFQNRLGGYSLAFDANDSQVSFTLNTSVTGFSDSQPDCDATREAYLDAQRVCEKQRTSESQDASACYQSEEKAYRDCLQHQVTCSTEYNEMREAISDAERALGIVSAPPTDEKAPSKLTMTAPKVLARARPAIDKYNSCVNRDLLKGFSNNLTLAFAAQDGKSDLFSDGQFNPGVELTEKIGYTWGLENSGSLALSLNGDVNVVGRKTAQQSGSEIDLQTTTGTTLKLGTGLNWSPSPAWGVFGVSGSWRRDWAVPVAPRTQQVCVVQGQGTNPDGQAVTINDCSDRFVGRVAGGNGAEFRFDWVSARFRLGEWPLRARSVTSPASPDGVPLEKDQIDRMKAGLAPDDDQSFFNGVSAGLIFSASAEVRDEAKPQYNVAVGPALYKLYQPLSIVGAVLFEFDDITNGSGEAPSFSDKFFVRLYVGVPFS